MREKSIWHIFAMMTLAVFLGVPAAMAQSGHTAHEHQGATQQVTEEDGENRGDEGTEKGAMTDMHQKMMQKHEQMGQHCKMMDSKLDDLAKMMNSATGESKVEAMEALLNELVSQRKSMHQMMAGCGQGDDDAPMPKKCKMMMEKKEGHSGANSE